MGRWGLTDPELLKALDEDPELVRMVEHLAFENGETPIEMLSRLARVQFKEELDAAFESPPGVTLSAHLGRGVRRRCAGLRPRRRAD
jgi:hypothetical protein